MRRWIAIFCIFFLSSGVAFGDEAESLFHQGNERYENGDYAGAVEAYERVTASGKQNWQLYFNLGNAYYKLNQIGRAILNYERALKLNSENEDIRFNLQLANLAIVDRIPEPPKAIWIVWVEKIVLSPSFDTLVWATLALYALFTVFFALKFFKPQLRQNRSIRFFSGTSLAFFIASFLWFSFRWYKIETEQYAIVVQEEVSATSSPTNDATEVFTLHEGTKLKIEQQSGSWVRIRLRDGKIGWLPADVLGMI
jgi:tetratricopeptide (TPR) repeat protein